MISLEQYEQTGPQSISVACPQCGHPLTDEGPLLYPKFPQQRRFTCSACKFSKVVKS